MFAVPEPNLKSLMEIGKVIRILAVALVVIAFAVKITTQLMFPEAELGSDPPITICLVLCLIAIFTSTSGDRKKRRDSGQ